MLPHNPYLTMTLKKKTFENTVGKRDQRTEGPESHTDGETLIFWD